MDPLKYLFEKPALTGKLACWLLLLAEFDIKYVTRKSVKGRAVAEFLADHPVEGPDDVGFEFPDESVMTTTNDVWLLYFDGAVNHNLRADVSPSQEGRDIQVGRQVSESL